MECRFCDSKTLSTAGRHQLLNYTRGWIYSVWTLKQTMRAVRARSNSKVAVVKEVRQGTSWYKNWRYGFCCCRAPVGVVHLVQILPLEHPIHHNDHRCHQAPVGNNTGTDVHANCCLSRLALQTSIIGLIAGGKNGLIANSG